MQKAIHRIFPFVKNAPISPIEALQQKTLNILAWGVGISSLILRITLLLIGDPDLGEPGRGNLYIAIPLSIAGILIILLIQRYIPYWISSLVFIIFLIGMTILSDTTMEVFNGETLIFFIIPIAIAGLLLRPWSGYVVAAIISVADIFIVAHFQWGVPKLAHFLLFFLIALIIQLSTSRLQGAMEQEQKRSGELRDSEAKYHRLIDLLPVGVLIRQEGKIAFVNPACLKLAGADKPEELIGKELIDLIHPDSRSIVEARVRAAIMEGKTAETMEEKLIRLDGSTFYAESSGTPLTYNGQPAILVVLNDVTERKKFNEAIAVKNQSLQEMSRKLLDVQERERRLLATELHDDLGQSLTSLKLMLELCGRARSTSNRLKRLTEARALVAELMNKVRNLSLELRPAVLDDFGLFAALRWLFDRFESQTGIFVQCNYTPESERRFEPHVETAVFRIIQEALTNVARHASASEAEVTISFNGALTVEVSDEGSGFDMERVFQNTGGSAGLSGMQERARLLGGKVEIISGPGSGTRVTAQIPLGGGSAP